MKNEGCLNFGCQALLTFLGDSASVQDAQAV